MHILAFMGQQQTLASHNALNAAQQCKCYYQADKFNAKDFIK